MEGTWKFLKVKSRWLGTNLHSWTWEHGENADTDGTNSHGWGPWVVQNIYKMPHSGSKLNVSLAAR